MINTINKRVELPLKVRNYRVIVVATDINVLRLAVILQLMWR